MPYYTFQNPETGEVRSVFQPMLENHSYSQDGVKWDRVFCPPQLAVDTKFDIHSSKDFVEKTRNRRGSFGDICDKAKELSAAREEKIGIDPVKESHLKAYEKKCKGKAHPLARRKAKATEGA